MLFFTFRKRKDLDPTKCERNERSVENIITTVSSMLNPFDPEQNFLLSLASGLLLMTTLLMVYLEQNRLESINSLALVKNNLTIEEPDIFQPIKKKSFPLSSVLK